MVLRKKMMFVFMAMLINSSVFAESNPKHPCHQDAQRFCKGIQPGGGAIVRCLASHEEELSQECRAKRAAMKETHKAHREACKGDVDKFCKDIKPGAGAIRDCLKTHQAELSTGCTIPQGF